MKKCSEIKSSNNKPGAKKPYEQPSAEIVVISTRDSITESLDFDDTANDIFGQ